MHILLTIVVVGADDCIRKRATWNNSTDLERLHQHLALHIIIYGLNLSFVIDAVDSIMDLNIKLA